MKTKITLGGQTFDVDLTRPRDISTRLKFDGAQPNAFGIDRATAEPYRVGDWVGDTREGGSVNCFVVTLCPHGNGTHTECIGHIVDERVPVNDILEDTVFAAWVTTVETAIVSETDDVYDAPHEPTDTVVTHAALQTALAECPDFVRGLIVRTSPNEATKRHERFSGNAPTYFTTSAMKLIRQHDFKHLLVDFPSVDREDDGGRLPNHRIFWDVAPGATAFENVPSPRTITEMIFVPDDVADGLWFATIQIPDFVLDAAPSRVRLFPTRASR